jgi:hypothetical protein
MSYNKEFTKGLGKINKDYLYSDFDTELKITEAVREENSSKIFTGGVRINNNMYWTDDEYNKYVSESLERKLP